MEKREPDKKSSAEWQREEKYLNQTLDIVKRNVENYESEIREMSDQIEEMLQHYHDNDVEVYTQMSNTVTMRDHMQSALKRNQRATKKPYFGRIDFWMRRFKRRKPCISDGEELRRIQRIRWLWTGVHR